MLGGEECCLVFDGYDGDERPEDFHAAAANFPVNRRGRSCKLGGWPFVFCAYYQDCTAAGRLSTSGRSPRTCGTTWEFGDELQITRASARRMGVYRLRVVRVRLGLGLEHAPRHRWCSRSEARREQGRRMTTDTSRIRTPTADASYESMSSSVHRGCSVQRRIARAKQEEAGRRRRRTANAKTVAKPKKAVESEDRRAKPKKASRRRSRLAKPKKAVKAVDASTELKKRMRSRCSTRRPKHDQKTASGAPQLEAHGRPW